MAARKHKELPFETKITTGGIGSIPAALIRKIMHENHMDIQSYNNLMHWYVLRAQQNANRNDRMAARAGLSQELMRESITWKTFMSGLRFLNIGKFDLDILAIFNDGHARRPVLKMDLRTLEGDGEILSTLYHQLVEQEGNTPELHQARLTAYIEKTRGQQSKKDKAAARASLSKELQKSAMTWRTFIKGLVFLSVMKFTLTITLYHRNKPKTMHFVKVSLDDYQESADDDE